LKKIAILIISCFILSGCATYKFQKSTSGPQGYLVSYDGYPLPEYTLGKDKSLPDLALAKERFKRRKATVEYYYKKMEKIQTRVSEFLIEPPQMIGGFLWGVLRWPWIAAADYKYNHNPKYKARIDRQDEERDALETAKMAKLRKDLDTYVVKDLAKESQGSGAVEATLSAIETKAVSPEPVKEEAVTSSELKTENLPAPGQAAPEQAAVAVKEEPGVTPQPVKETPVVVEPAAEKETPVAPASAVEPAATAVPEKAPAAIANLPPPKPLELPVAVITAKPLKGISPLKVKFSGQKSFSKSGKIVAYLWDFGDGDTSALKNPENTYWSTTFGSRNFTVTLTVRDQAGSVSSTTSTIEVITR